MLESLSKLSPAPLTAELLGTLQPRGGVYVLFLADDRVYVGKADRSLPARLGQHAKKLSGRVGPFTDAVKFTCLYVEEDLEASAPEKLLIKWYRTENEKSALPWNNNGFGNNDPGKRRDTTEIKANHFDALYPINLDLTLPLTAGKRTVADCLAELKGLLPYTLRFGGLGTDSAAEMTVPSGSKTVREWVTLVVEALPSGWLATALPGYVILYRESDPDRYKSATSHWFKGADGSVIERPGQGLKAPAGEIEEDEADEGGDDGDGDDAQDA